VIVLQLLKSGFTGCFHSPEAFDCAGQLILGSIRPFAMPMPSGPGNKQRPKPRDTGSPSVSQAMLTFQRKYRMAAV
jgi:hypothetical protein